MLICTLTFKILITIILRQVSHKSYMYTYMCVHMYMCVSMCLCECTWQQRCHLRFPRQQHSLCNACSLYCGSSVCVHKYVEIIKMKNFVLSVLKFN